MIKKIFILSLFCTLLSCGSLELVLKDNKQYTNIKDRVFVILEGDKEQRLASQLYSYFGNNKIEYEYILLTTFSEKKENRIVKKNQVAQQTDYSLEVDYDLFYKNRNCKVFNKKINTNFSFLTKSSGYNFGADRSFEELYSNSIKKNIQQFVDMIPDSTTCL